LGTLLGYATVLARRSGIRWVGKLVDGYQALIGGVPLVVILMVLYYVVFGAFNISGTIVSIMAFTLAFGAISGSTMWTAVDSVDVIQEETGLALGYTREEVFKKIIFPQARQQFTPQLMGQFVSLVKDTAIVGYISVQDLTRASDLIRSRTMDAFFPLISTAIIYFLFCRVLAWVLGKIAARFDVYNRSRQIEGIEQ
jgi:polar amino acid transport system substrate-binding protein